MAHEYAMKHLENSNGNITIASLKSFAWEYAEAMQAEADKRKPKPELPSLQQTFINGVEQPRYAPPCEEWQPDWSQSPNWSIYWAMNEGGSCYWFSEQPIICTDGYVKPIHGMSMNSQTFGFKGYWKDSLRKRPD